MEKYKAELAKLNRDQRRAVEQTEGPVLVIAGPGTGKTQLLSTRAAYLIANNLASSENILCLTFTDNAAFNMKRRMVEIIGERAYKITTSTYHSFGSELLQRRPEYYPNIIGAKPIDDITQYSLIGEIINALDYENPLQKSSYYLKDIISTISDLKTALISPESLRKLAKQNLKDAKKLDVLIKKHLASVVRISNSSLGHFNKLLINSRNLKSFRSSTSIKSITELFISELNDAVEEAGANDSKPITAWKNKWLEKNYAGLYSFK